jgi:hypothetical protein
MRGRTRNLQFSNEAPRPKKGLPRRAESKILWLPKAYPVKTKGEERK